MFSLLCASARSWWPAEAKLKSREEALARWDPSFRVEAAFFRNFEPSRVQELLELQVFSMRPTEASAVRGVG